MIKKLLFILLAVISFDVHAQKGITFPSGELQNISKKYTGSDLNWPIVLNLALHNISDNSFELSSASLLKLESLSKVSITYQEQQNRLNTLIGDGATVFAKEKLEHATEISTSYLESIRAGNLDGALEAGSSLKPAVDELEASLLENRLVTVQAQLSAKDGFVDKRLGLLSDWEEAFIGDLFEESDGVQTREESYATLAFTDGSAIKINHKTTAVIRK